MTYFLTVAWPGCEMTNVVHMVSGQLRGDNGPETGDSHTPALITRHTQGHQKLSRIRKNE